MKEPFDLQAGTTEFYRDPLYYDFEYKNRTGDVGFYVERYLEAERVLELAVGSGRIAAKAVRKGAKVFGIDLSASMLVQAERRRSLLPSKQQGDFELRQGDMRDFDLGRQFPLIACPFNAFQHLYTREDVERCLACVVKHLEPDGRFIVDVLLPDVEFLNRPPLRWFASTRFRHPTHNAWYGYAERSAWDPVRQINQIWFRFDREPGETEGPEQEIHQLSHRYFSPPELESLLHYNGLELVEFMGDFEGGPLVTGSESTIAVARLRR
jgi:SAM-dependent methyltransferase